MSLIATFLIVTLAVLFAMLIVDAVRLVNGAIPKRPRHDSRTKTIVVEGLTALVMLILAAMVLGPIVALVFYAYREVLR